MRPGRILFTAIIVVLVLIALTSTFYTLPESQQAIITQFGKPVGGAVMKAGLHVKIPFIQRRHKLLIYKSGRPYTQS